MKKSSRAEKPYKILNLYLATVDVDKYIDIAGV